MSSSQSSNTWRLIGAILLVLLLILLWMMGRGPNQAGCCGDVVVAAPAAPPVTAPVTAPTPPAVAAAPVVVAARVLAQYDGAKVTLVGEVSSDAEKKRLVDAAIASYGAGNVVELLTVKSGLAALDKITLAGNVPSEADKTARGEAAGKAFAPAVIDNQLLVTGPVVVAAPPSPTPVVAEAKAPDCGKAMQLRVSFATGSAVITAQGKRYLDAVVQCVNGPMLVGGHTDNVGSEKLNAKLSAARANAVKTYLVSKGVKSDLLSTQGFGASKPVAKNTTPAGRASNRRIELSAK
jgi:outer membrane protein OmpA-like peptidoglycan-associated protein